MGNGICCNNQHAILNTLSSINNQNKPIISHSSANSKSIKSMNLIIPYNAFNNIFFIVENIIKIQSFFRGYKLREVYKSKVAENKNIVIQIPLNINLTKISTTENNENNNNEHFYQNETENINKYPNKSSVNNDNLSNKSSVNNDNLSNKNSLKKENYLKKSSLKNEKNASKNSLKVEIASKKISLKVDTSTKKQSEKSKKMLKKSSSEKNQVTIFKKFSRNKIMNNQEITFQNFTNIVNGLNDEKEDDILSELSNSALSGTLLSRANSLSPKTAKSIYSLDSFCSIIPINSPVISSTPSKKIFLFNSKSLFNHLEDDKNIIEIYGYFLLKNQKINLSKIKDGFNILKLKDGSYIKSIFKNKEINGIGKFYDKEKEIIYNGYYKNNIPLGYALMQFPHCKLEGYFEKNYIIDYGIEIWSDSTYYQGQYLNNKKNGIGFYRWPDGTTYEGEWENNKMNGYGIFTYFDDRAYSGKINNGYMNGVGIFKWKNGNYYFGEYEKDVKNGFGIYIWEKKPLNAFCGFFVNGVRDGIGMRIIRNNVRYGIWKDGKIDDSLNGIGDFKKYMKKEFFKYRKYFKKDFISNYVKNINFEEYFYTIVKVKI